MVRTAAVLLILSVATMGCEKPNPNPELLDPIYRDLMTRKSAADSEVSSGETELKSAMEAVGKATPQTGELKRARRGVEIVQQKLERAKQESLYLGVLIHQRKKYARKHYLQAYHQKQPWPPKEEYEHYKLVRRLREAPLSWDAHLPKLPSRIPADEMAKIKAAEAEKAKKAAGGGGH